MCRSLQTQKIMLMVPPHFQISSSYFSIGITVKGTRRGAATSRKVAGSILDGIIGTFHWHNLPAALWPWGRLRNEYQEYFLGLKAAVA
jgi:hypothetical protein